MLPGGTDSGLRRVVVRNRERVGHGRWTDGLITVDQSTFGTSPQEIHLQLARGKCPCLAIPHWTGKWSLCWSRPAQDDTFSGADDSGIGADAGLFRHTLMCRVVSSNAKPSCCSTCSWRFLRPSTRPNHKTEFEMQRQGAALNAVVLPSGHTWDLLPGAVIDHSFVGGSRIQKARVPQHPLIRVVEALSGIPGRWSV